MKNFSEAMAIKDSLMIEIKLLLTPHGSVPTRCWVNGEMMVGDTIGAPVFVKKQIKLFDALEVRIKIEREHPNAVEVDLYICLLYTSPSPRDGLLSRMPSSA